MIRSWVWTFAGPPYRPQWEPYPAQWRITRAQTWGLQLGLVAGPMVRPRRSPGKPNPWFSSDARVTRWRFVVLPWFHVWWWRTPPSARTPASNPGRIYIGGKVVRIDPTPQDPWARPSEADTYAVTPSVSFRRGSR